MTDPTIEAAAQILGDSLDLLHAAIDGLPSSALDERPSGPDTNSLAVLVAQGLNNRDIAKQLFISENTVKNHIRNILEKLHLHSRMEAVVYAVREKMIEIT